MSSPCNAVQLTCEMLKDPIGIDETTPRFSWIMLDKRSGASQTAWQIQVASMRDVFTEGPLIWDSGKVAGNDSLDHPYVGKELVSRQRVFWRVRLWDYQRKATPWSRSAVFEMGLLKRSDWRAHWIGSGLKTRFNMPCPHLRTSFSLEDQLVSARLYVTALGIVEPWINGVRVSDDRFSPGWTVYDKRINVLTYDVTAALRIGVNRLGCILATGWYAGRIRRECSREQSDRPIALCAQLEIEFASGRRQTVCSNLDWEWRNGPFRAADFYDGEIYDARLELPGWAFPGGGKTGWRKVKIISPPQVMLTAKRNLPVRSQEVLKAKKLTCPNPATWVFDLGQNMVGVARFCAHLRQGQKVRLRFAEMLNADGTLYLDNLRTARSTDLYTAAADGRITWEPHFTFHGFRYVEVTGLASKPRLDDLVGVVLHSEISSTGQFRCSNQLVNRLQKNILWGLKGNFLEVPSDCPQRDERLGWTGDAQVFVRTACFNRDVATFFEQWILSMTDDQHPDGRIPNYIPNAGGGDAGGAAAWGDAVVICPWTVYQCYRDRRILEFSYDAMRRWVDWRISTSKDDIHQWAGFGDWLAIDVIAQNDSRRGTTPNDLISTAYHAYTAGLLAEVAAVLGKKQDVAKYRAVRKRVVAAFDREFVSASGRVVGETQTGYLLALGFNLLPEHKRAYAVKRLVHEIESRDWHLSTGFVGTPLLVPVLTRYGQIDVAYRLLLQETYPSWLYSIRQGATTMWERWNSYSHKDGFGNVQMNSFNHYAYGAIGEWLYASVVGIDLDPSDPGYRHVLFQPRPGGNITWAKGSLQTRYGKVSSSWAIEEGRMTLEISLPPNTTGTVKLPDGETVKVKAGEHKFKAGMETRIHN